ncbi:MAG TPA: beta-propeller fold lactonase family protein [Terracidiphilus sp.]|nr:beta-propeller fold lactonase family protein [Terracidiphilus sp.]
MKFMNWSRRSQVLGEPNAGENEPTIRATRKPGPRKAGRYPRSGRSLLLVAAGSLLAASLVTACSQITQTLTVDFVYVACTKAEGTNNYGEINVFEINSESGRMRQIPSSPFPSQGRNPVAEAVSVDYGSLFVVNQDDNAIEQFGIGTDGKLYPYNTVNTPGIFPLAIAANKSNMFVLDLYQPLPICSDAAPCSGSIAVFPLTAASGTTPVAIGTPAANPAVSGQYWPLTLSGAKSADVIVPTAVNVLASGAYVYVTAYDSSAIPNVGYVFGFSVGQGGVLAPLAGSPFAAGVKPSAIASDSSSAHIYVTDFTAGNVLAYSVASSTGVPSQIAGSPFKAGNQPSAIVVDTAYSYAYVTNSQDSNVTAYSISSTGALSTIGTYATGLDPVAVGIDPSTEHFLYTINFLNNTVSGFELSTTNGTLLNSQFSPYVSNDQPSAVAAIPHNGTGSGIAP